MSNITNKFDQSLKDLVEAFAAVNSELADKFGEDDEGYQHALLETVENAIEASLEDTEIVDASFIAGFLTTCSEALENLDPEAFSNVESEDEDDDYEDADEDADYEEDSEEALDGDEED